MLAEDLALALDPVRLLRRLVPGPDEWQERVLRSTARQIILLIARQVGKSTASAALAAHTAVYEPGSLTLCLSPSERQSSELHRKAKDALAALGIRAAEFERDNVLSTELASGSRIVALPGREQTVRGYSGARLLLVDEASRVPDALYMAVRPMLAVSGGRIVLLSTPFGKRGFFHHEWAEGGPGWERVKVTAAECRRIDPAWLAEERATIGDWWYDQEYGCEFKDSVDQVFATDDIMAALSDDVAPLFEVGPASESAPGAWEGIV